MHDDFPMASIPLLVQLGLTYRCNLKCPHCYALYRRDLNEFTTEEAMKLINDLYDAGASAIVYSHGENMIRKDFHDVARAISDLGMYQTLMANGFYVKDEASAERLKNTGVNRVLISLDSSIQEEHDRNRGQQGAYEVALKAADLLRSAGVPTVGFSTTIDAWNYARIPEIVGIALEHGLHAISFMQNRYNRPGVFQRPQWREYHRVCREIYEISIKNRGVLDVYTHDPFMLSLLDDRIIDPLEREDFIGANACNVGKSMVSIDPVGNVVACNFLDEVFGNVREEPFSDIWNRLVNHYANRHAALNGPCSGCSQESSCAGGCQAFHFHGIFDERCGEIRFGENIPHRNFTNLQPLPQFRKAAEKVVPGTYIPKEKTKIG